MWEIDGSKVLFPHLFSLAGSQIITVLEVQQLRGQVEHFHSANEVSEMAKGPTNALLSCADEQGVYIRCPGPADRKAFRGALGIIQMCCPADLARMNLLKGELPTLVIPDAMLSILAERDNAIWVSADVAFDRAGGISRTGTEAFRFPTIVVNNLIGLMEYRLLIGGCKLASAVIAILLRGARVGLPRIVILCAGNSDVFQR